jgi:SMI1/KNR4 family protein SUKH-1
MTADPFEQLLQRMERSGVATRAELLGCSSDEIGSLERLYNIRLPEAYRRYLEVMGHRSGKLFTHDHMAVSYPHVLRMTAEERKRWAEAPAGKRIELPPDALVVAARLGDQFEFLRCHDAEDSPFWYYNSWDRVITQTSPSVIAWLNGWCSEAERAIASGYFDDFPNGTTP